MIMHTAAWRHEMVANRDAINTRGGNELMSSAYPHFKSSYTHEELVEHFLLTPADLQLVLTCRGDANRCGMALLLKALPYLGYVPEKRGFLHIPAKRFNPGSRCQSRLGPDPDFGRFPNDFLHIDRPGADARRRSRSALQCLQGHRRKARPLDVAGYRAKGVRTARPDPLTPPVAAESAAHRVAEGHSRVN
jgi:hypothetical protein